MILVATCRDYPHPTPSLEHLLEALESLGIPASYRPWKGTPLDVFAGADLVLPLCCWDYHDEPQRFLGWIDSLEARGARLINTPETLRGNLRKTYLLDMAAQGLAVPRTFHLRTVTREAIEGHMRREDWDRAVLKPVSGQSGYGVRRLEMADPSSWELDGLFDGEALLQEYQPDIGALGETTLTFIDGAFSHAVRRVLRTGEWRANQQYGITPEPILPDEEVIEAARRYLDYLPQVPVYARVDGLARPEGFMLMELELIEPYLYLEFAPGSAVRLAQALVQMLR